MLLSRASISSGEDILSTGTENHGLAASADIEVVVLVQGAQVAGAEPSVFGEDFFWWLPDFL